MKTKAKPRQDANFEDMCLVYRRKPTKATENTHSDEDDDDDDDDDDADDNDDDDDDDHDDGDDDNDDDGDYNQQSADTTRLRDRRWSVRSAMFFSNI